MSTAMHHTVDCQICRPPVLGEWQLTDGRITGVKINFDDNVDENAVRSPQQ